MQFTALHAHIYLKLLEVIRCSIVHRVPPKDKISQDQRQRTDAATAATHKASSPTSRMFRALGGQTPGLRTKGVAAVKWVKVLNQTQDARQDAAYRLRNHSTMVWC
jgi:hypothetical protein